MYLSVVSIYRLPNTLQASTILRLPLAWSHPIKHIFFKLQVKLTGEFVVSQMSYDLLTVLLVDVLSLRCDDCADCDLLVRQLVSCFAITIIIRTYLRDTNEAPFHKSV